MTPTEFRALYEGTFDRMAKAEWIDRYVFKDGEGVAVSWTEIGASRAGLLKAIVQTYGLRDGPHHARLFDLASENRIQGRPTKFEISETVANAWRICMDELQLDRDDFDFSSLVHVIVEYAPDLPRED
jgi:hypothetical protein